jgi:hypothetical protein
MYAGLSKGLGPQSIVPMDSALPLQHQIHWRWIRDQHIKVNVQALLRHLGGH